MASWEQLNFRESPYVVFGCRVWGKHVIDAKSFFNLAATFGAMDEADAPRVKRFKVCLGFHFFTIHLTVGSTNPMPKV
jgi:hypothetical protein